MPETPKKPEVIELIEFVDRVPAWALILALAAGIAVGAAFIYFFTEHVEEGKANNA